MDSVINSQQQRSCSDRIKFKIIDNRGKIGYNRKVDSYPKNKMHNYVQFHGIYNTSNYEGGSRLTQTLVLFLMMWAPQNQNSFMDTQWQNHIHCWAGGHAPHFCALELIQDDTGPCHSECRTALYHQIPYKTESKTNRNSSWVKCTEALSC